jgi:ceramide glucosyltransferase
MFVMNRFLIATWIALTAFFIATVLIALLRYRRPSPARDYQPPPCSIILPIKGISAFLESNVRALAMLEPFRGEILLAVANAEDPAIKVLSPIAYKHSTKMKLLVGESVELINPKLRNMEKAYRESRENIILFLDDSVELNGDLFAEIISSLKPGTLAATAAPWCVDAENFPAEIEAATCNGYLFRIEMFLSLFGMAAAFGNALAFHKHDLEIAGGFRRLTEGPCEDNALSKALREAGVGLTLVPSGIRRRIGRRSWGDIYWRHVRWKNCVKAHDPIAFLIEPLIGGLCFNLLGAYAISEILEISYLAGLGLSMAGWYGLETILHLVCGWRITVMTPLSWIARDIIHPFFTLIALFTTEIRWRGDNFKTHS